MLRFGRGLSLVAAILICAGPNANADEAADKAKQYNATARTLFNVGKFEQAAVEYEKAYQAKPVPEFLHNMAQCYKRLDSIEFKKKALFNFESYLANEPEAANRQEVEEEIATLKQQIEEILQREEQDQRLAKQLTPSEQPQEQPRAKPIYKKWWFWTAVGAVLAGSVVAIAVTTGGDDRVPQGADGSFTPSTF